MNGDRDKNEGNVVNKLRIMLVDDSSNLRHVIKRYIASGEFGMELIFFEAGDGAVAMQTIQEQDVIGEPIDVIFLDWMMPRVTGYEFLMQIKSMEPFKERPFIVMLTAETYAEQINAIQKYNVDAYVTKPFTQEDLVSTLMKIVDGKGLKRAV